MVNPERVRAVTALRSVLEASLLKGSIAATLAVAGIGVIIGLAAGSKSIVFDGLFSLVDAVIGIITLVVARLLASEGSHRFQYGYWHLEPLVLALHSAVLLLLCGYAFLDAVQGLLTGGHAPSFGMGIAYAAVVTTICFAMVFYLRGRNQRIESELITLEVQSWMMSGAITLALLLAFVAGRAMAGTRLEPWIAYVDPLALALLAPALLPVPLRTARQAIAEIFLITSPDLDADVQRVMTAVVARHGFTGFKSYAVEVGRARFIEASILVPATMPVASVADFDRIRHDIGEALGGAGPELWLTIMFTSDPGLA